MSEILYDFSVIVLCYNPNIDKLKNTIKSIVNQKNVTFEVVVCDDGSNVDYKFVLYEWTKNFINVSFKFLFSNTNKGTIKNYLTGICNSSGLFIKPISPGDYLFDENTLFSYKQLLSKHDVVFSDCVYYQDNKVLETKQFPKSDLIFNKRFTKKSYCLFKEYFVGATIACKKNIIYSIMSKLDNDIIYSEDLSTMLVSFFEAYDVRGINKNFIWYEFGTGVSTNSNDKKWLMDDNMRVYNYIFRNYASNSLVKRMKRKQSLDHKSFLYKLVNYFIFFPDIFFHKLLFTIKKKKKCTVNINEMYKIISVKDDFNREL